MDTLRADLGAPNVVVVNKTGGYGRSDGVSGVMSSIWLFIVIPLFIWVLLFTWEPDFVTCVVGGVRVLDKTKLFIWSFVIGLILAALLFWGARSWGCAPVYKQC